MGGGLGSEGKMKKKVPGKLTLLISLGFIGAM